MIRRLFRWLFRGLLVLVILAAVGFGVAWLATQPEELAAGTESAARLAPGSYPVGRADFDWADPDGKQTAPDGSSSPARRALPATMWYPQGRGGKLPLLVFSHGLMSTRFGCTYMAEHLASHGYVVVSADHPFTHMGAPEGPNHFDVVNQPRDLSFLIDQTLRLGDGERPFQGTIDLQRIGAFGISLGADTVTLVAFHPEWRDSRIAAVISIAGHGDVFGPAFFDQGSVPFLMIVGTADGILDYEVNAAPIPGRIRNGGLVTIAGATHAGFSHVTAGFLRVFGNPDRLGCWLVSAEDIPQEKNPFVGRFGTPAQGLIVPARYRPPCSRAFDHVLRAGRQHSITKIAVRAFFESRFADSPGERTANRIFLEKTLPSELKEVTYLPALRQAGRPY